MTELSIYVRTNLKTKNGKRVPNGKLAAQSAHALMSVFLSMFKKESNMLVLLDENKKLFDDFKNKKIKINYLPFKNKEELNIDLGESHVTEIIDQGRTFFKEPTLTAIAIAPKDFIYRKTTDCGAEINERYRSKQAIVLDKEYIKDRWEMFSITSEVSLDFLLNSTIEINGKTIIMLENEGLKAWIEGAFAKVTLQPVTTTMLDLLLNLEKSNNNVPYSIKNKESNLVAIAVGADFVDKVDKFTKEGFKLV